MPGLTKDDFIILEDKVPQQVETFSDDISQTTPLYIGVLIDTSASTAGKLKFQQESAMNFIQTVVKPRKDRVLYGTFDDEVKLRQDFTDKLDLLDRAVYATKQTGTHTSLYDAVWQLVDEKMRSARAPVTVLVTDGGDTFSRASMRDAIDIAQRTETTVFTIQPRQGSRAPCPVSKQARSLTLNRAVNNGQETGGTAFFTGDMLSLERSFTKISKELRASTW